jgi:hypothetical protein
MGCLSSLYCRPAVEGAPRECYHRCIMRYFLKKHSLLIFLLIAAGCAPVLVYQLDQQYGMPDSTRYVQPAGMVSGAPEYWRDVRPVLEQRCTVCHGCYDAPCQQNLTSWEGIARGSNPELVYDLRLDPAEPSRLFVDAKNAAEWRNKNFHPVLNERANTREANLNGSALYRLLDLKRKNPLPDQAVLDSEEFTFSLSRKQSCPVIEKMEAFEQEHPHWGMPYGLPSLSEKEFSTIENWLAAGAPVATHTLPVDIQQQAQHWEVFFNGTTLKQQLMSRYLYEHLFLAHLYFDELQATEKNNHYFFRLVRSSTPPGTPIAEIASRRPYDDPGQMPFWYRLRLDEGSVVEKTHMPYALNALREKKWTQWFLDSKYTVETLPSYEAKVASNPFVAFQALPVDSRYRFLLDEAQFVVDNFIKGPVCRGQVSLSVIEDHGWVFFMDPDQMSPVEIQAFLTQEENYLRLPAEEESDALVISWLKYSKLQKKYLEHKAQRLEEFGEGRKKQPSLDFVWNGNSKDTNKAVHNDNAALTIFRHTDSASVVKGLVGPPPKTAWLIGYALLERIHYLLVAGFDVYGNVGHQLNTRLYMDFLRMEAESNFLMLLPRDTRPAIRDFWYRDASDAVKEYLFGKNFNVDLETSIQYKTDKPQQELYGMLAKRLGKNLAQDHNLVQVKDKKLRASLMRLQAVHGEGLAVFPQNSILRIDDTAGVSHYVTLLNNSGFSNISGLFKSSERRLPAEDYLTVVPGIVGAYPNAFFQTSTASLADFITHMESLKNEADYTALTDVFAVRRTNPDFWAFSDALHHYYKKQEPVAAGMLDYNRFENR